VLGRQTRGVVVGKTQDKLDKQIKEIEDTQEALRQNIEQAKELAEKAQELLQQHKSDLESERD
jgi:ABC-type transporter Mla subunit MlaD